MNKKALITVIVIVVLIALGYIVYAAMDKDDSTDATVQSDSTSAGVDQNSGNPTVIETNSTTTVTVTPSVKSFTVNGKDFSFSPSTLSVKKGDTVKITFVSTQGFHNLKIDEFNAETKTIPTGQQDTITFVADKAGSFEYYCSVGTHRALGMHGTLTVAE